MARIFHPGWPAVPAAGSRDPRVARPEIPERRYWPVLADGVTTRTMETLAGGAVLTALALALGADGATLGLVLAVVPALGQAAQIAGTWWVRRTGDVKLFCIALVVPARLLLLAVAAIPFLDLGDSARGWLVPLLAASALLANMSGAAWSVWMNELLPRERLGRFFSTRLAIMSATGLVALAASALWLGLGEAPVDRVALVFAAGAAVGLAGALFIGLIPPRRHVPAPGSSLAPWRALRRSPEYRQALPGLVALTAGVHLVFPFTVAACIIGGGYSAGVTLALVALVQVVGLVSFPLLGRLSDGIGEAPGLAGLPGRIARPLRGHARVSAFGAALLGALAVGWAVAAGAGYPLPLIVALFALQGLGAAAVDLGVGNIQMTLAPRGEAPALFAGTAILRAAAAAGAGLVAGAMLERSAAGAPWAWIAGGALMAAAALVLLQARSEAKRPADAPAAA